MSTCAIFQSAGVGCHFYRSRRYLIGLVIHLSLMFLVVSVSSSYATSLSSTSKISTTTKKNQKKTPPKIKKKASIKPSRTKIIKPVSTVVQARAVYCVNLANNETLVAKNQDERLPIASLTKLVTALVTLDHMALDKEIEIPSHIKTVPKSVVGLKPGDMLTVEDLLHGMLISSGNDCAESLACAFPGGKTKFIQALNKKARDLGAKKTEFFTPSGLDRKPANASDDTKESDVQANMSTAREIADITRIAFSNKTIRSISQKKSHVLVSKLNSNRYPIRNTNKLLRDNLPVIGGKTGFTVRAGHCLASEFSSGKDQLVIVVLGSPDHFRDTRLLYLKALKHSNAPKNASAEKTDRVAAK
jgi:D-alanyl-D-alanine carboxypeptidase